MPESGLGPAEVGKEIAEHNRHAAHDEVPRAVSILEAVLLAVVALLAAWSGYAAARWSTESRLELAQASTARTEATLAYLQALEDRNFDAATFNAWFGSFVTGNEAAAAAAERRFRDEFQVAFDAWLATEPIQNPDAPQDPTFMPEYEQQERAEGDELTREADERYAEGSEAGETADDYVRITVALASVLFIVGISSHFRVRGARYALVVIAVGVLVYSAALLIATPKPA